MKPELAVIKNPQVRTFYMLYWSQHQILVDFYTMLPEDQYDFCLSKIENRNADTPRESLAHIIYVQYVYLSGVKSGKLEFSSMGTEHFSSLPKEQLITEWEKSDAELYAYLTADVFESGAGVEVPWGGMMNGIDLLFFLRDHDILHIGWNLALMDLLDIERYPSLAQYWG